MLGYSPYARVSKVGAGTDSLFSLLLCVFVFWIDLQPAISPGRLVPMTDLPRITIITPVYNGADLIQRTIDSIHQQVYANIEHIVMDAGSTDGTLDVLRASADRLTWVSEPDKGQSDALNKGFARATGQYLTWLNADDFFYPGTLRHSLDVFEAHPGVALVYGRLNLVHRDGSLWKDDRNVSEGTLEVALRGSNFISQPGTLFTRQAWEICGPLRVDLHHCMDWDLWFKIMKRFPIQYTPRTLAAQAVYAETKTSMGGLPRYEEIRDMIEGHGGSAADTYFKIGYWYYQHNQMRKARQNFRIAQSRGVGPQFRAGLRRLILKTYLGGTVISVGRLARARRSPKA